MFVVDIAYPHQHPCWFVFMFRLDLHDHQVGTLTHGLQTRQIIHHFIIARLSTTSEYTVSSLVTQTSHIRTTAPYLPTSSNSPTPHTTPPPIIRYTSYAILTRKASVTRKPTKSKSTPPTSPFRLPHGRERSSILPAFPLAAEPVPAPAPTHSPNIV